MTTNLSFKLTESKVIRELGFSECLYDNELMNNNMFQVRAFISSFHFLPPNILGNPCIKLYIYISLF